ncbi:MAG: DUF2141 domain-containing protein [Flavobacterium sp.]|nr:DUF2141 domain-containing protein [Flavobacterium sp.]
MKKLILLTALLCAFVIHSSFDAPMATVRIEVSGLKNDAGEVLVSLYDNEAFFPEDAEKAISKHRAKIINGTATLVFTDVRYGRYAAAVMHDENKNEKLDTNGAGIPIEGFGFSNNAKGSFGPPSFKKASFNVSSPDKKLKIKTRYFF